VSASGPPGYATTGSAGCTGTIAPNETKTCELTSDDIAPQLTVVNNVVPAVGAEVALPVRSSHHNTKR